MKETGVVGDEVKAMGEMDISLYGNLDDQLARPIKVNEYHDSLISIKLKLNWIGYGKIKITDYFGKFTKKIVMQFQRNYELPITGMIDSQTVKKLNSIYLSLDKQRGIHYNIKFLKRSLNRIGFGGIQISDRLGSFAENRIREFQSYFELPVTGRACFKTINQINEILASPFQLGKRHPDIVLLKSNLNQLGYGRIELTSKFGKLAERKIKEFQYDFELPVSGIADKITLNKIENTLKNREKITYINYDLTLDEVLAAQAKDSERLEKFSGNSYKNRVYTEKEALRSQLNPDSILKDKKQRFQFLDLSRSDVVTARVLNKYLLGNELLENKGEAFIHAGYKHGISELYLLLQAVTGFKDNPLASGVPVDERGNITYTEVVREGKTLHIPTETSATYTTVYNIYGDSIFSCSSLERHVKKAFDEGWNSIEKAIIGGAKYIKEKYIGIGKYTFYDMLWNPKLMTKERMAEKGSKDYINSVLKQVDMIYQIYQKLDTYTLYLSIPVYKDHPRKID